MLTSPGFFFCKEANLFSLVHKGKRFTSNVGKKTEEIMALEY